MNELSLGLLVCIARILPPVLLMPPLSWWGMPFWLRLGIGLVVGLAAAPMAGCSVSPGGAEMLADDLAAGLAMALIVSLPFWALQVAGTFTQTVAGWADEEHGRLPEAFFLFGLAVVAAAHGHSWIAAGLVKSCAAWPGVHNPAVQAHVIASASEMLGAAVLIAIPMLAICGVAHVAMAVAQRLHAVELSLPIRPAAAIVGSIAAIPLLVDAALREVNAVVAFLAAWR